jgi:DNA-binding MarR family transcriptional regulator
MASTIQRLIKQRKAFRSVEEEVFVGLQLVADRLMEPWERHLKEEADLTTVQYNLLRILRGADEQGLTAGEIGERLIARSPDVTRLIDRLEKRGLVRRRRDPEDRRAVRIAITQAGRDKLAPLDEIARAALKQLFDGLSRAQLNALRDTLDQVLAANARV